MHYPMLADAREARRERRRRWMEANVWFPLVGTAIMLAAATFLVYALCIALRMLNVAEGLPADYPAN
jgi:hypothetical protein